MKTFKRLISIMLCAVIAISLLSINVNAAGADETLRATGVVGTNSYGAYIKGGLTYIVQGADEATDSVSFTSSTLKPEMTDAQTPVATYYYNIKNGVKSVNIPVGVIVNNKDVCDFMTYMITTSSSSYKSNMTTTANINSAKVGSGYVHSITGPAPTKAGEVIEFNAELTTAMTYLSYFQLNNALIINAKYKIKIRLVGYDTTVQAGKTIASNSTSLAYSNVYATARALAVYNVDTGSSYSILDAQHSANAAFDVLTFKEYGKNEAKAEAYIDVTKYSDMHDTDIFFVHKLAQLYSSMSAAAALINVTSNNPSLNYSADNNNLPIQISNNTLYQNIYTIPFKLNGPVPSRGESVEITVTSRCSARGNDINGYAILYNSDAPVTLTVYGIDKTDLKAAIDTPVLAESEYTADSYSAYTSALSDAQTVYGKNTASQTEIDEATSDLNNAISSLVRIATVTFKDSDGTVLQSNTVAYGTTPTYSGETPTKAFNETQHYIFDGWTPAVVNVSGNAEYTAVYRTENHSLEIVNDGDTHHSECECGYKTEPVTHTIGTDGNCPDCGLEMADYSEINELIASVSSSVYYTDASYKAFEDAKDAVKNNLAKSRQDEVDAMADDIQTAIDNLEIKVYPVSVPDGCSYTYSKNAATNHYKVATITAPMQNGAGEYFSYWTDENGNVVSTYLNYTFYSCTPRSFKAVYGKTLTEDDYIASEVLNVRDNLDGTYSILVEHSASSKISILGHGVLFTYDNGKVGNLVLGSTANGVFNPVAASTASTRTGLFEVKITVPDGANNIYLKPYVMNTSGEAVYGDNASFTVDGNLSTSSVKVLEVTELTIDETSEDLIVDETPTTDEPVMPDYQLTIWEQIVAFFMGIWKFIMSVLAF